MVELQDDRVGFAAVDAWMFPEVRHDSLAVVAANGLVPLTGFGGVVRRVALIVFAPVPAAALAAVDLPASCSTVFEIEVSDLTVGIAAGA